MSREKVLCKCLKFYIFTEQESWKVNQKVSMPRIYVSSLIILLAAFVHFHGRDSGCSFKLRMKFLCHNLYLPYFFCRDLRLHKLVFEEDVLPDGTEVAYYTQGKVL